MRFCQPCLHVSQQLSSKNQEVQLCNRFLYRVPPVLGLQAALAY